ncbi:MAG: hypothetical protein O2931_12025 [Planctomycetota bacterium]|nr:hypothetical protein [Planctomycetota bacterium]
MASYRFWILLGLLCCASQAAVAREGFYHRSVHADRGARWFNARVPWSDPYAHTQWGSPVALVLPPNSNFQTDYSRGVARTRMTPVYHQFGRPIATPGGGATYSPTPIWPSDTNQFGVYGVRAPW